MHKRGVMVVITIVAKRICLCPVISYSLDRDNQLIVVSEPRSLTGYLSRTDYRAMHFGAKCGICLLYTSPSPRD